MAKANVLTKSKKQKAEKALQAGRLDEAAKLFQYVVGKDPMDIASWLKLGAICGEKGDFNGVAQCSNKVLALDENNAQALSFRGNLHTINGQTDRAIDCYIRALRSSPENPDILTNLAVLYLQTERLQEAIDTWEKVIELKPDHIESRRNLALTCMRTGSVADAVGHYSKLVELKPKEFDYLYGLAKASKLLGKYDQAEAMYHRCLPLADNKCPLLLSLADLFRMQSRLDKAIECCEQALEYDPSFTGARISIAGLYYRQGDREAAYGIIDQLMEEGVMNAPLINVLSEFCHDYDKSDFVVEFGEKLLAEESNISQHEESVLHFNLGRVLDKMKHYDRAFHHYRQGNELVKEAFDRKKFSQRIDQTIEVYSVDNLPSLPRSQINTERPVFIIGMPRSGTSLIEQILDSHSQIQGAGELGDIARIAHAFIPGEMRRDDYFPNYVPELKQNLIDLGAERYLNKLNSFSRETCYVTDKMPQNFLLLGLIWQLFPGAKIIHCQRDPLDTALSIYFQHFMHSHDYSFDLEDIGYFYNEYQRIMVHWKQVLDLSLLDVHYQGIVDNFDITIRGVIDFLGLEWEDACLNFYKSERKVATASYDQVRSPIYSSSVDRWKHYSEHLRPLMDMLGIADPNAYQQVK